MNRLRYCSDEQDVGAVASSRYRALALALVALVLVGPAACDDDDDGGPTTDPPGFTAADGINGGTMYDKFWSSETGWNQSDPNLTTFNNFANFFRCKQCHAWDRLGNEASYIGRAPSTSRPNVSSVDLTHVTDHTPQELFDELSSSTGRRPISTDLSTYDPATNATEGDMMPDLSEIMTDAQIWDLVKFLLQEANDVDLLYGWTTTGTYPTGSITYTGIGAGGDAANGDALYAANCVTCHGADGRAILVDGEFTVGSFLRSKPYEVQHKVKFGQPGSTPYMGSLLTDIDDILDLYAALTNETNYPDPAFELASGINGGTMYDKFWTPETGWNQSDPNLATFNNFSNFFRCKQCHAWDRLGNAASYIGRAPSATRPNVSSLNLKTATEAMSEQDLFDALWRSTSRRPVSADLSTYDPVTNSTVGDQMPDLSDIMTEDQVWDLVKFLLEEANDVDRLYDWTTTGTYPTGSISYSNIGAGGNASNGDAVYAANCVACHGNDGTAITVDGSFSVGSFLRAKPYEVQHKVKFGQPGTAMGSLVTDIDDILDLYLALTNATTYPDPAP
jgi:mono/diheme cytochrome c family protein